VILCLSEGLVLSGISLRGLAENPAISQDGQRLTVRERQDASRQPFLCHIIEYTRFSLFFRERKYFLHLSYPY
jgi:hypothetical protein